jgi:predicted DsbA family dithiol-disulfide isomerase
MNKPIPIQIVSDVVCPWCYIGKRRLEKALAERPGLEVEITWLPFQLSPDMPREGRDRREHYESIFGEERARQISARMKETGAAEGIDFDTPPGARSPKSSSRRITLGARTSAITASSPASGARSASTRPRRSRGSSSAPTRTSCAR